MTTKAIKKPAAPRPRERLPALGASVLAAAIAVFGLAAAGEADASPSRYVFEMCDSALPGGGDAGVVYHQNAGQPWSPSNTCGQPGGALAITQSGEIKSGGSATWALPIEPPPGGRMESISVTGVLCPQQGTVAWIFFTSWPRGNCTAENRVFRLEEDFRYFVVELQCSNACLPGAWIRARQFATTMVDPVSPVLEEIGGSLLSGNVQRGRQTLTARAADVGGGVSQLSVLVNGLPAAPPRVPSCSVAQADNASVEGTVAAQISPCPERATAQWTLDTAGFPFRNGSNQVRACATDFSTLGDAQTTCTSPRLVEVDATCAESGVPGGDQLSAQFESSNAESVTVGFGQEATVSGKLATAAGDPVRGATLCVKAATEGAGRGAVPIGSTRTDYEGRFSYTVAPGPNREIVIGYRHDSNQLAREVRYFARAQPELRVNRRRVKNGARVRFRGRLPAPGEAGRVVILQAGTVGSKRWITFRRATANSTGIFRAKYRFSSTTRRTRYKFRAIVPRQAGYPYLEGASRRAVVVVRPR